MAVVVTIGFIGDFCIKKATLGGGFWTDRVLIFLNGGGLRDRTAGFCIEKQIFAKQLAINMPYSPTHVEFLCDIFRIRERLAASHREDVKPPSSAPWKKYHVYFQNVAYIPLNKNNQNR